MVGTLALDYVSLVSKDVNELSRLYFALTEGSASEGRHQTRDPRDSAWHCDGIMLGKIPRQPREHGCLLQVPGLLSEVAVRQLDDPHGRVRCSRFDLQVSVPVGDVAPLKDLYSILSNPQEYPWRQPGKPPRVTYYQNSEQGETIYIGARTSDIMQRIYIKCIDGRHYVRYEAEVKGRLCHSLESQGILYDQAVRATFMRALLSGLPDEAQQLTMSFAQAIGEPSGELIRHVQEPDIERTLRWFVDTVIPSLKRACAGEYRPEVLKTFEMHGIRLVELQHETETIRLVRGAEQ